MAKFEDRYKFLYQRLKEIFEENNINRLDITSLGYFYSIEEDGIEFPLCFCRIDKIDNIIVFGVKPDEELNLRLINENDALSMIEQLIILTYE